MKTQILFSTLLIGFILNIEAIDRCKTPLNRDGYCVKTDDCPPIKAILENPERKRNDTLLIKDSHCGTVLVNGKYVVKVCCDVNVVSNGCVLPEFPENGSYTMNGKSVKVGERVPKGTVLTYQCNEDGLEPIPDSIYCQEIREWNANVICSGLKSPKVHESRNNDTVLISIGGFSEEVEKIVELFHVNSQEWIALDMSYTSVNKTQYAAISLNHLIIIIGGKAMENVSDTVHSFSIDTLEMKTLPSLNYKRYGHSAVKFKGNVYALGGFDMYGSMSRVEKWNPDKTKWSKVSSMNNARGSFGAAVIGNIIFVAGGYDHSLTRDTSERYLNSVEAYNPSTNKWRTCKPLYERRIGPAVAAVDGYLYVVGGFNANGHLNTGEKYDPKTEKWFLIRHMEYSRLSAAACNFQGQLVIAGGYDDISNATNTVDQYDPISDEWMNINNQIDGDEYESIANSNTRKIIPSMKKPRSDFNLMEISLNSNISRFLSFNK